MAIFNRYVGLNALAGGVSLLLGMGPAIATPVPEPVHLPAAKADLSMPFMPIPPAPEFQSAQRITRLVLRLSERRLYYYRGSAIAGSYPVAIGSAHWETPTGEFTVLSMQTNPAWQHPFTGEIVPPGPHNPLGARWIGFWTDGNASIGFHGTDHPELIGQPVSHGCVRMRNEDITDLFDQVTVGTPVAVIP